MKVLAATAALALTTSSVHALVPTDFSNMLTQLSFVHQLSPDAADATAAAPASVDTMKTAPPPPPPRPPQLCWKHLFHRDTVHASDARSCPAGMELVGDACFSKCSQGFVGIGAYCMPERTYEDGKQVTLVSLASMTYQRKVEATQKVAHTCEKDGLCYEMCPANTEAYVF
jgi:hypothetical protein